MRHVTLAALMALVASAAVALDVGETDAMRDYYGDLAVRAAIGGKSPCQLAGMDAQEALTLRYNGAAASDQMRDATLAYERALILAAYELPRMASERGRAEQISEFRNRHELACYSIMGDLG